MWSLGRDGNWALPVYALSSGVFLDGGLSLGLRLEVQVNHPTIPQRAISRQVGLLDGAQEVELGAGPALPAGAKVYTQEAWAKWDDRARVRALRNMVNEYAPDPRWAPFIKQNILVPNGVQPQDWPTMSRVLLAFVQQNVYYLNEPGERIQSPWRTLQMGTGDCLPEDTLLLRHDYELVPIKDIRPGDRIWGKDRFSLVDAVMPKGKLPVDRIKLNNGSTFEATANHKVYVNSCEKHGPTCPDLIKPATNCRRVGRKFEFVRIPVSELQVGMEMLTPSHIDYGAQDMDPARAFVEGLFVADGWAEDYRFSISGKDGKPKERQKRMVESVCRARGIHTRWHDRYIAINDPEWARRLAGCGHLAPNKRVLSLDLFGPAVAALFTGLLADTGNNTNGNGCTLTTTSALLGRQFRILAKMQGMTCSQKYIVEHGGLGTHPIWRYGLRDSHRSDNKAEKRLRVKSIEREVSVEECWDLQTDDHYVYLPDADVTVSNCDDMSLVLATMASSIGLPNRFALAGRDRRTGKYVRWVEGVGSPSKKVDWSHIYVILGWPPGQPQHWVSAETILRDAPLGYDVTQHGLHVDKHGRPSVPKAGKLANMGQGSQPGFGSLGRGMLSNLRDKDPEDMTLAETLVSPQFHRNLFLATVEGIVGAVGVYFVMEMIERRRSRR